MKNEERVQKVDVYVMMKNEIKMLPYFLRHYEQFAERIYVWDDHSTDGTYEMLKAHPRVKLLDVAFSGIDDDYARMNFFPRYIHYSRGFADWVMQVDVDEFVYHPQLLQRLKLFKEEDFDLVMPVGYLMVHDKFPTTTGQIYDEMCFGLRDKLMDKPVIFRPELEVIFGGGRHRTDVLRRSFIYHPNTEVRKRWKSEIKYLHFRYFGLEDYVERIKRNCQRMAESGSEYGKLFWPYRDGTRWRMPDGTKEDPEKWFPAHLHEAIKVVG